MAGACHNLASVVYTPLEQQSPLAVPFLLQGRLGLQVCALCTALLLRYVAAFVLGCCFWLELTTVLHRSPFSVAPASLTPCISFQYNLDDSGWRQLGGGSDSNTSATSAPADAVILDTIVSVGPGLLVASSSCVFVFDVAVIGGTNDAPVDTSLMTVEARLDGAALWTPLVPGSPYIVNGLRDGEHYVEARSRWGICCAQALGCRAVRRWPYRAWVFVQRRGGFLGVVWLAKASLAESASPAVPVYTPLHRPHHRPGVPSCPRPCFLPCVACVWLAPKAPKCCHSFLLRPACCCSLLCLAWQTPHSWNGLFSGHNDVAGRHVRTCLAASHSMWPQSRQPLTTSLYSLLLPSP